MDPLCGYDPGSEIICIIVNVNVVVIQIRYSSVERACCSDPVGEYPAQILSRIYM